MKLLHKIFRAFLAEFKHPRIIILTSASSLVGIALLFHPSDPVIDGASFLFVTALIGGYFMAAALGMKAGAKNTSLALAIQALVLLLALVYSPQAHQDTTTVEVETVEMTIDPIYGVFSGAAGQIVALAMSALEQDMNGGN